MKNQMKNPLFAHSKDTHFQAQKQIVFSYLLTHTSTMKMVEVATGIDRANICRFVAEFREQNTIISVYKSICKITGRKNTFACFVNYELYPTSS